METLSPVAQAIAVEKTESICVLIPCPHEEKEIGSVVADFKALWPHCRVVIVDNCSTEGTLELARNAGAEVFRERRRGKAQAILSVLPHIDTDILVLAPGDGSYPAEGGRRLLEFYRWEKPAMITGVRRTENSEGTLVNVSSKSDKFHRRLLSLAFGQAPDDLHSELRLMSRFFYKNIPILLRGLDLELELNIQALDKNFRLASVPVPYRKSGSKCGVSVERHVMKFLRFVWILLRDYKPMFLFGTVSAFFFIAGLTVGSIPIYEFATTGVVRRLLLPVLAAALMIIAFFTFQIGIVMESSLRYRRETYQTQLRSHYDKRQNNL